MAAGAELVISRDLVVAADHGQIYIYSSLDWSDDDPNGYNRYLEALEDAVASGRFVGTAGGLVDLMTPGQWHDQIPMQIQIWAGEPPADTAGWDHEVDLDFDIDAPDGGLTFEASGGGPSYRASGLPTGRYRMRTSGRGFGDQDLGVNRDDAYRLRLWPRDSQTAPELRKRWPGWDAYH